jgi:hypothetical protein
MKHLAGEIVLFVNLMCHIIIFYGALYVVLHNKRLPTWHVTPLWYAGLSCLLTAITIVLGYAFTDAFPLSYANLGVIGETSLNVCLASIAIMFFISTAKKSRIKRK